MKEHLSQQNENPLVIKMESIKQLAKLKPLLQNRSSSLEIANQTEWLRYTII